MNKTKYTVNNYRFTAQGWVADVRYTGAMLDLSISVDEVNALDCINFEQAYQTFQALPLDPRWCGWVDVCKTDTARARAENEMEVIAELDMLTAALPLVDPDADIDWNQSGEKTDAAYMQASEARYKLPPSKYGVSTMQEFAEKRDRQFWEYYNKRGR